MYLIADKYFLDSLMYLAKGQFELAMHHCCQKLWYPGVVEQIYAELETSTPPGLVRDTIRKITTKALARQCLFDGKFQDRIAPVIAASEDLRNDIREILKGPHVHPGLSPKLAKLLRSDRSDMRQLQIEDLDLWFISGRQSVDSSV